MKALLLLVGFLTQSVVATTGTHEIIYRNGDYGITLPVPNASKMCPTALNDTTHHGTTFLLGTKDISLCKSSSKERWITIWAEYNASEDTKTLHSFLQWQCRYEAEGKCQSPPAGLKFSDLPSEAAHIDRPDGSIEILVVTQAGKPDPDFDSTAPANNYELKLHTNRNSFDQDMTVFREVLRSIRISPDGHKKIPHEHYR